MPTIKRASVITLSFLLILSCFVIADAQRRGGRIRRTPGGGTVRGAQGGVEYHPWPAATCPICALRAARGLIEERRAQGLSSEAVSVDEVRDWTTSAGVEVNPALVRSRIAVALDHESLETVNAGGGGVSYNVEIESRRAPNGGTTYIVYDGSGEPIYIGSNSKVLVRTIKERAGNSLSINVRTRGLSKAKGDAIRSSLRIQQGQFISGSTVEVPPAVAKTGSARSAYSMPGARLVEGSVTQPTFVTSGRFKGFYTSSLRFANAGRQLTLRLYAKSREALRSMVERLTSRLSSNPSRMSMKRLLNQARRELKKTHNLTDRNFLIQLEDELMNTFFVQIPGRVPHKVG